MTLPQEQTDRVQQQLDAVRSVARSVAAVHGLELVDVEWIGGPAGCILRVIIEHAEPVAAADALSATTVAGVTLEDCVRVSRDLSTALDAADPITQAYRLEVTSPGIDRPLKTVRDFRRQLGKVIKAKLLEPSHDGQTVLRGVLDAADEDGLSMTVDGNEHRVALDKIRQARVVLAIGEAPPSRGGPRRGASRRGKKSKGGGRGRKSMGGGQ